MYVKNLNTVYVFVHFSTLQIGKIFDVYIELHNFRTNKNCYRYLELPWLLWSYWLIERWIYYKIIEKTYLVKRLKLLSHTTFFTWKYPDVWRRLSTLYLQAFDNKPILAHIKVFLIQLCRIKFVTDRRQWISCAVVSSAKKTDHYDIAEILLKVALKHP